MSEKISSLIKEMAESKLIIPSFQRSYIWKKEQIEALFDSLLRDIPVSALLIWKLKGSYMHEQVPFEFYKFFKNYNSERKDNEETSYSREDEYKIVIDGQQRLTSIYIGFYGSYSEKKSYTRNEEIITRWLYLKLPNESLNSFPEQSNLNKEEIDILVDDYKEEFEYQDDYEIKEDSPEANKYKFKFLSADEIRRITNNPNINEPLFLDKNGFHWLKVSAIPKVDIKGLNNWNKIYSLDSTEQSVVLDLWNLYNNKETIEIIEWKKENINEAITVFVRYNSNGTVLTPAQVIQSIIEVNWPNVRRDFKDLTEQIKQLGFKIDVNYLIKALLTIYTDDPQNNIKRITKEVTINFKEEWDSFSKWIVNMFKELASKGFSHRNIISYNATIPILYFLLQKKKYLEDTEWKRICIWLMKTLLWESFSSSSDSAIRDTIKVLQIKDNLYQFPDQALNEALKGRSKNLQIEDLLNIKKENRKAPLLVSILMSEKWNRIAELDHLHPISIFNKREDLKCDKDRANSIVNLHPLRGIDNTKKNDTSLEEWIKSVYPTDKEKNEFLISIGIPASQSLSLEDRHLLWDKRYEIFKEKLDKIFI